MSTCLSLEFSLSSCFVAIPTVCWLSHQSVTNKHSRDHLEEGRAVEGQLSHKDPRDKRLAQSARVTRFAFRQGLSSQARWDGGGFGDGRHHNHPNQHGTVRDGRDGCYHNHPDRHEAVCNGRHGNRQGNKYIGRMISFFTLIVVHSHKFISYTD
jgi:hypothetical protein